VAIVRLTIERVRVADPAFRPRRTEAGYDAIRSITALSTS
jgi:hypothetical protein